VKNLTEKKKKKEEISLDSELRKVQGIPLNQLSHQLGVEYRTARLIQNIIRGFLRKYGHEEESHKLDNNQDRPIFIHKIRMHL